MSEHFTILEENPNELTGGKGCLCHENGGPDTKGPFVVFNHTETDSCQNPFPVMCANCVLHAHNDIQVVKEPVPIEPAPRRRKPKTDDIPEV